jgi:YbbR domain-containing protein
VLVTGLHFVPDRVAVTVEIRQVETSTVPVKPILSSPGAGYVVSKVDVDPTTVTLAGKHTPDAVETERIDISGLRGTETYSVLLRVPEGSNVLGVSSAHVTVTVAPASDVGRSAPSGTGARGQDKARSNEASPGVPIGPAAPAPAAPAKSSGDTATPGEAKPPGQDTRTGGEASPTR